MVTYSSVVARKIPWTDEPGRLQSMGLYKSWTEQLNNKVFPRQYFGHLMWRVDSLEKTLMLGGIGGRRRRGRQRMRWLDGITDSMDMSLSDPQVPTQVQGGRRVTTPTDTKICTPGEQDKDVYHTSKPSQNNMYIIPVLKTVSRMTADSLLEHVLILSKYFYIKKSILCIL